MISPKRYQQLAEQCEIPLSDELIDRSNRYLQLLRKWRRRISLMSDQAFDEILDFHLFEAFWAAHHFLEDDIRLADVGSGAGFPGLAATLYRPSLETLLIESNRKKSVFLETASRELGLSLEVFPNRAEEFAHWNAIQVAAARALTPSAQLLQILKENRVELLLFHGSDYKPLPVGWKTLENQLFPLSSNRWVSRFAPSL